VKVAGERGLVDPQLAAVQPRLAVGFVVTTITGTNRAVVHFYNRVGRRSSGCSSG